MDLELRRRKRWFRALDIAELLFEYEGYFADYLEDLENFLEEEEMYSPKISEDLIPQLYRKAKVEGIPMTRLVDQIIRDALNGKGSKKRGKKDEGRR